MSVLRTEISPTLNDFEIAAAQTALRIIASAVQERGRCLLALSGGSTPQGAYRHLGDLLTKQFVELSRIYLIFVDDRMVPPDHPESNYRMVHREFISRLRGPGLHVYRIRGEAEPNIAAREYDRELQTVFELFSGRCDLMLLGVGTDGHTASLFPGTEILHEEKQQARAVFVPHLDNWRVTLTLPVINRARNVMILATGKEKAAIVRQIFQTSQPREDLPASLVRPDSGTLTWILDAEAASGIPKESKL